jgi:hypothetical protein
MTKLVWSTFSEADCQSFNIYRAITGIAIDFPNGLLSGDTFIFAATSNMTQMVRITSTDIDSVAAAITAQSVGLSVTKSLSGTTLFIRCSASQNPKLKLVSCSFLMHTAQAVRTIIPRSEFVLIGNQPRVANVFAYQHTDNDGAPSDWYRLTSVKASVESLPTLPMQALISPESLCVVEGRVIDAQNRSVSGAEVRIAVDPQVGVSENTGITTSDVVTRTDKDGRWSIPLPQNQSVLFRIPSIGYNQFVTIPAQAFILFKDLVPTDDVFDQAAGSVRVP